MARIVTVDSDLRRRTRIVRMLEGDQHSVCQCSDGDTALETAVDTTPSVDAMIVAWDLRGPMNGMELLARLVQIRATFPRIVLSPLVNVDVTSRVKELGAIELLLESVRAERLSAAIQQALKGPQQPDPLVDDLRQELTANSDSILEATQRLAHAIRKPDLAVLLIGENGTGKEWFARALHRKPLPADGSEPQGIAIPENQPHRGASQTALAEEFAAVNLPAISPTLIESELFGHEKHAFTDAKERRLGKFETAAGGTLLLDEIGCLEQSLQPKLLRVIQEREFTRVGGTKPIGFKARLVCATNRDLIEDVKRGVFREDLYYRINQFEIRIPPLRERKQDLRALADRFAKEMGLTLEPEAHVLLEAYSFPGNIRELRAIVREAGTVCSGRSIRAVDMPAKVMQQRQRPIQTAKLAWPEDLLTMSHKDAMQQIESLFNYEYFKRKLTESGGNKERAAETAGLTAKTLRRKLKECGLGHLVRPDDAGP